MRSREFGQKKTNKYKRLNLKHRRIRSEFQDSWHFEQSPIISDHMSSLGEILSEEVNSIERIKEVLNSNVLFWRMLGCNIIVW